MAHNLLAGGYEVVVYDFDPGRVAGMVGSGARAAGSGEEARELDVLFTSLPGPRQCWICVAKISV
jgi:3-hydroxyisobutyrate dehydrogenase-like beta-hydroxyacid dehydrogenase